MSNKTSLFTYVNDQDIQSFLENKSYYAYKLSFLGTTGKIVAHNEIYGVDNEASYVVAKSLTYLNNELSELAYDFNESSYVVSKSIGYIGNELSQLASDFDESSYVVSKSIGYIGNELSQLAADFDESSYVVSKSISNLAYSIDESSYVINKSIINLNERVSYLEDNQSGDLDLSDYVTKSELESQSYLQSVPDNYVTKSELEAQSYLQSVPDNYVTKSELEAQSYAGYSYVYAAYAYVLDTISNLDVDVDLSAYVSKSELEAQSYAGYSYVYSAYVYLLNTITDNEFIIGRALENCVSYDYIDAAAYVKKSELSAQSYAGYSYVYAAYSYVLDTISNLDIDIDLSAYVSKSELAAQSYLQSIPDNYVTYAHLNSVSYVSKTQLQQAAYVTSTDLSAQSYAGYSYVYAAYNYIIGQMIDNELIVASALTDIDDRLNNLDIDVDLSAYVSKSELVAQSYLQSVPDNYVTKSELEAQSYLQSVPDNYVTKSELSAQSYAGYSYVYDAYSYVLNAIYDNEYVTAYALIQLNDKLLNVNEYIDFSPYVPKTWMNTYAKNATLNTYVKKSDLNTIGYLRSEDLEDYATKSYAVSNLTSYAYIEQRLSDLDIDMSAYVSKSELSSQAYLTSVPAEYITQSELSGNSYCTTSYAAENIDAAYAALHSYISTYFSKKPVIVWQTDTTGLVAIDASMSSNPAWQLTNLDFTPFKFVKVYTKAAQKSGTTASASTTPAIVLDISLDSRAAITEYGGAFLGSTVVQKSNDNNRLATLTCAISADKTKFVVLRMTNLYGTAATDNSDVGGYVFKIEGYYDDNLTGSIDLSNYATKLYIDEYFQLHPGGVDLSPYVTKTELSNAGYITSGLPSVSASDNGKILMVVNGAWAMVSPSTIYSGNATPSNANGNNGDIYLQS